MAGGRPTATYAREMDTREATATGPNQPLLALVDQHRADILRLVAQHRAENPRIFGSVARGDATVDSDLDLLVDFTAEASLLDLAGLRLSLVDLLHVNVDIVDADTLRGEIRQRILAETIPV